MANYLFTLTLLAWAATVSTAPTPTTEGRHTRLRSNLSFRHPTLGAATTGNDEDQSDRFAQISMTETDLNANKRDEGETRLASRMKQMEASRHSAHASGHAKARGKTAAEIHEALMSADPWWLKDPPWWMPPPPEWGPLPPQFFEAYYEDTSSVLVSTLCALPPSQPVSAPNIKEDQSTSMSLCFLELTVCPVGTARVHSEHVPNLSPYRGPGTSPWRRLSCGTPRRCVAPSSSIQFHENNHENNLALL